MKSGDYQRPPSDQAAPKVRPDRSGRLDVELILVGRDLLQGYVGDGNGKPLAEMLANRGAIIHRIVVVDDTVAAIAGALREALERSPHLVVTTGGLGPGIDDRTLEAVAEVLCRPCSASPAARSMVEQAYRHLHEKKIVPRAGMTAAREKICHVPVGSTLLPNEIGIAPGVVNRLPGGTAIVSLPGMPREARAMLDAALPDFKHVAAVARTVRREIEAPSADESALLPLLQQLADEYPKIRISSRPLGSGRGASKVLVTLEATADTEQDANGALGAIQRRLLALASGSK